MQQAYYFTQESFAHLGSDEKISMYYVLMVEGTEEKKLLKIWYCHKEGGIVFGPVWEDLKTLKSLPLGYSQLLKACSSDAQKHIFARKTLAELPDDIREVFSQILNEEFPQAQL